MNYRYLYRAKRTDNGEWILGSLIQASYLGSIRSWISCEQEDKARLREISSNKAVWRAFEVRTDTICQCTSLKDKNGKLIWENDIVKPFSDLKGIVRFGERDYSREFGFYIEWMSKSCYRKDFLYWAEKCEVIGSAIDNPELLEVNYEQSSINNGYAGKL